MKYECTKCGREYTASMAPVRGQPPKKCESRKCSGVIRGVRENALGVKPNLECDECGLMFVSTVDDGIVKGADCPDNGACDGTLVPYNKGLPGYVDEVQLAKMLADYMTDSNRSQGDMELLGHRVCEHVWVSKIRPPKYYLVLGNTVPHFLTRLLVGYYNRLETK